MNYMDTKERDKLIEKIQKYNEEQFSEFKKKHPYIIEEAEKSFNNQIEELNRLNYFKDPAISKAYEALKKISEKESKIECENIFGLAFEKFGMDATIWHGGMMSHFVVHDLKDTTLYKILDISNEIVHMAKEITKNMTEILDKEENIDNQTIENVIKQTFPSHEEYKSIVEGTVLTTHILMRPMSILLPEVKSYKPEDIEKYKTNVKAAFIVSNIGLYKDEFIIKNFVSYIAGKLYDKDFTPVQLTYNPLERIRNIGNSEDLKPLKPDLMKYRDNLKPLVDYDNLILTVNRHKKRNENMMRKMRGIRRI